MSVTSTTTTTTLTGGGVPDTIRTATGTECHVATIHNWSGGAATFTIWHNGNADANLQFEDVPLEDKETAVYRCKLGNTNTLVIAGSSADMTVTDEMDKLA